MAYAGTMGHRRRHGGTGMAGRLVGIAVCVAAAGLVAAPIAYMLWPAPRAVSLDAPSLPITIGGVAFNVPPAAIRFKVQRRPGAQARIDLSFVWPSLTPPDLSMKPLPTDVHHSVGDARARAIVGDRAAVQLHAHVAGATSRRAQDELGLKQLISLDEAIARTLRAI